MEQARFFSTIKNSITLCGTSPFLMILTMIRTALFILLSSFMHNLIMGKSLTIVSLSGDPFSNIFASAHYSFHSIPYGILTLYILSLASLTISIIVIHYTIGNTTNASSSHSQHSKLKTLLQLTSSFLLIPLFYSTLYFTMSNQPMPTSLLIFPWIYLSTFFIPTAIAHGSISVIKSFVTSLQLLHQNFAKVMGFIVIFGIITFGVALLQFSFQQSIMNLIIIFLLAIIVTIKDIFSALVMQQSL